MIATKGGLRPTPSGGVARDASAPWIRQGVDESLRALGTDYIDLYQVHCPDPNTPFEETPSALKDLVATGKIRHVGVSNFNPAEIEEFSVTILVETLQPPYHLFRGDTEAEVLPYAAAHDIGVLVYGPLAHGLLSGHLSSESTFAPGDWRAASDVCRGRAYRQNLGVVESLGILARELDLTLSQLAVAWVLTHPAVDVAIVGTRDAAHVREATAASQIGLSGAVLHRIDEIMLDAVAVGGPAPEMMPAA